MRKITKQAQEAFKNNTNFKQANTEIFIYDNLIVGLYLHGNRIAFKYKEDSSRIFFSLCGWPSNVTRERLQAAGIQVSQVKGKQFLINDDQQIELKSAMAYCYDFTNKKLTTV